MLKNNNGIYIVGDSLKFDNSKYPNDKYDRELYIPKAIYYHRGKCLQRNMLGFMKKWQKIYRRKLLY